MPVLLANVPRLERRSTAPLPETVVSTPLFLIVPRSDTAIPPLWARAAAAARATGPLAAGRDSVGSEGVEVSGAASEEAAGAGVVAVVAGGLACAAGLSAVLSSSLPHP